MREVLIKHGKYSYVVLVHWHIVMGYMLEYGGRFSSSRYDWYVFLRGFSTLAHFDGSPFSVSAMTSLHTTRQADPP
jgi:hypothetical protein